MNPARRRSHRFGDIFEKSDDVVIGSLFNFEDLRNGESRPFSNPSSVLSRNLAKLCHCLAGEHFNFKPDLKLALVRPDFAHLRPGIAVDHGGNIKATALSEKRFCTAWPKIHPWGGLSLARMRKTKCAEESGHCALHAYRASFARVQSANASA